MLAPAVAQDRARVKRISWADTGPLRTQLEGKGITSRSFPSFVERVRATHARRVREGDLDHLVFYILQATRFTTLPPIEPALSAKALVDGMEAADRAVFLRTGKVPGLRAPATVRSRMAAFVRALDSSLADERLAYFRSLVRTTFPDRPGRAAAILAEYFRVMRFVYEKEFVAQRSGAAAVAELYRARGLSTDTAVEAGYLVYLGLGVVKALEPGRRIRRVLIVGPGLDLAPRTGLLEAGPPESYQPWAVIDALLALRLSRAADLEVVAADINPRVVEHLRALRDRPPRLDLVSEIRQSETVTLAAEYRDYFARLGRSIGELEAGDGAPESVNGHLRKTVLVGPAAARTLRAETLDIVTERLEGAPFDLVIATNILPYFDDRELLLALTNVASMIQDGGVFLHNEARPLMLDATAALGLPFEQSRHVTIATVRGAPAPLFDSVFLHRKAPKEGSR
jgi:hypothetical protein